MPVTGPEVADYFEEPTEHMYAELGREVAYTFATARRASTAGAVLNHIDDWIKEHWGYAQYPRNEHLRAQWAAAALAHDTELERAREAAAAAVKEKGNS